MKRPRLRGARLRFEALLLGLAALVGGADAAKTKVKNDAGASPLEMVLQLMDQLSQNIVADGDKEAKAFKEFFEWCDDASKNKNEEITTYTAKQGQLEAKITELREDGEAASGKVEDLASRVAENEKELVSATKIFKKETSVFKKAEAELEDSIDTITRAMMVLQKEMEKNPASLAQIDTSSLDPLLMAMTTMNEAAGFLVMDAEKISSLLQETDEDENGLGLVAKKPEKSKSASILDVLADMRDKAEGQLDALRKAYVVKKQEYKMLKQGLETQLDADNKDLTEEKSAKAEAAEKKATAEKNLATTIKLLADAKASLANTQKECMHTAADHDANIKDRASELQVIAKAKKIVQESTSLAQTQSKSEGSESDASSKKQTKKEEPQEQDQEDGDDSSSSSSSEDDKNDMSFLQVNQKSHSRQKAKARESHSIALLVQKLAKEYHSRMLHQLASRVGALLEFGSGDGDGNPFDKVKDLLRAMVAKLEKDGQEASNEKAYCDEQTSKTGQKQDELEDAVEKLKVKIDEAKSASAGLKEDVSVLGKELAALAKEQGDLDMARTDENKVYLAEKKDLTKALKGVRKALGILRDFYGGSGAAAAMLQEGVGAYMAEQAAQPKAPERQAPNTAAGGSIISILEVTESSFAKELAALEHAEATEQSEYEETSRENAITKKTKEMDVKAKTQNYKTIDANLAQMSEDLKGTQTELDAVNGYFEKVKQRCAAKPDSYAERQKRRNNEIKGLRKVLAATESEAALVQARRQNGKHSHSRNKQFLSH